MKGLQTASIVAAESFNSRITSPSLHISEEAALRFPVAVFGAFVSLLLFLVVSELFGRSIGLISAALRAVEPMAIGFDRIAKEDTLVLFFFLLCSLFFTKSQTAAERDDPHWLKYFWGSAASFGALMSSKYYPHLLAVLAGYYNAFLKLPGKKWSMGKPAWLKFFIIMGATFVMLNPTIVLPDTWREMLKFSSEGRIGHDSYEYMGVLYPNKMTSWLNGIPWTFYYVFIAVKSAIPTLVFFLVGLPLIVKRKFGDGRFFILMWAFMWFMPFTVLGGKFTRYFTLAEPIILIVAAVGFYVLTKWVTERSLGKNTGLTSTCQAVLFLALLAVPTLNSLASSPHYRLFTNAIGGGMSAAGSYFPHDEFYDLSTREITAEITRVARPAAMVACETPTLFEHYAKSAGREDLIFVSLSDPSRVARLGVGDLVVEVRGRHYRSNTEYLELLDRTTKPVAEITVQGITSARVYQLDETSLNATNQIAAKQPNHN
jgi:4-amino-4-deoxy-L-arabinose transferase-like glycosyltransferase